MADETLADRLQQLIRPLGWGGLSQLAKETGLTKSAISKIASGDTLAPEPKTLRKLADHFGVQIDWLAHGRTPAEGAPPVLPRSPADRARLAAAALEYAPAAIEAGTAQVSDSDTARAIFARIVRAEGDAMAPANDAPSTRRAGTASSEPKVLGTRKDVIEAGKLSPDDALAAEEARQKAEAEAKAKAEAKASAAPPPKGKKR